MTEPNTIDIVILSLAWSVSLFLAYRWGQLAETMRAADERARNAQLDNRAYERLHFTESVNAGLAKDEPA